MRREAKLKGSELLPLKGTPFTLMISFERKESGKQITLYDAKTCFVKLLPQMFACQSTTVPKLRKKKKKTCDVSHITDSTDFDEITLQ